MAHHDLPHPCLLGGSYRHCDDLSTRYHQKHRRH